MPKPTFFNLSDAKRARITEAALDEFARHRYHAASISRVVAAAGISKGSLYQYFDHKLDLYRWLLTDVLGRRKALHLGKSAPPDGDLFDLLEHHTRAGLEFTLAHPRLWRLAVNLLGPTIDPDLAELADMFQRQGHAWLVERLGEAQAAGVVRPDIDLDDAARLIDALNRGLGDAALAAMGLDLTAWLDSPDEGPLELPPARMDALLQTHMALLSGLRASP